MWLVSQVIGAAAMPTQLLNTLSSGPVFPTMFVMFNSITLNIGNKWDKEEASKKRNVTSGVCDDVFGHYVFSLRQVTQPARS